MSARQDPSTDARQIERDNLQRIMDDMNTDDAPLGELVINPLKEALNAGQVFTPSQFKMVDSHFKTFLSSVGCAQSPAEHAANEKKATEKYASMEVEVQMAVFSEWSRLESMGPLTPQIRTAAATAVWNEKKTSSRLAGKLEKQQQVLEANRVFRAGIPFCSNRFGRNELPNSGDAVICGKVGLLRCAACKNSCYCSPECQKKHWAIHKAVCAKK